MFGRRSEEHSKKRSSFLPFVILRMLLSLSMLAILLYGGYRALVYFSGVDPINFNPKSIVLSFITSEDSAKTLRSIMGFPVPTNLEQLQYFIQNKGKLPDSNLPDVVNVPNEPDSLNLLVSGQFPILSFAVVADTHNDNIHLAKALLMARERNVKFVIGLGDYSDVGTIEELQATKQTFEAAGLPFYLAVGDHDLWDARDKGKKALSNFEKVFGAPYQAFGDGNVRFIILYNSDNLEGVDELQWRWFQDELSRIQADPKEQSFVFLHEPIYHPSSDHVMGKDSAKLSAQATQLVQVMKTAGVSEVFAGDTHYFSRYTEPRTGLKITTVGAVTESRNTQAPRFAIIDVYENGSYNVNDVQISP